MEMYEAALVLIFVKKNKTTTTMQNGIELVLRIINSYHACQKFLKGIDAFSLVINSSLT